MVLTTIHSAKGLEFDCVYYFHTHDWYKNYDLETLEEDRRLFYVGISRAKEELYVFDHTEIQRTFEDILRDFDSLPIPETHQATDLENAQSESVTENTQVERADSESAQTESVLTANAKILEDSEIHGNIERNNQRKNQNTKNQSRKSKVIDNVIHVDFSKR